MVPILLIALMVQILAPIGATWAAAIAASDPFSAAEICHGDPGSSPQDDHGALHGHDACMLCCVTQAGAWLDTPQPASVDAPYRRASVVIWSAAAPPWSAPRAGSNAQARAPPVAA